MEACNEIDAVLGVVICKNLFLCNRQKTGFYLLMMPGNKKFKTKELSSQINSARLSFAEPEDVLKGEDLGCHPCVCTSSLKMKTADVIEKFLPATGHDYMTVHLVGED